MLRAGAHAVAIAVLATVLFPCRADADPMAPDGGPIRYVHPVDAPVVDPFRAPLGRYGPGNRGLEYGTAPGDEVRAAAPGVVIFAGTVAGARHVTVMHADGRRSSYSFLAGIDVRRGQQVDRGAVLGRADGPIHVGLREGDTYVDPALFFGVEILTARLIPENPRGSELWQAAAHEVVTLTVLTRWEGGGPLDVVGDAIGALDAAGTAAVEGVAAAVPVLVDLAVALAPMALAAVTSPLVAFVVFEIVVPVLSGDQPPILAWAEEHNPVATAGRLLRRGREWWEQLSDCTPDDVAPPPPAGPRVAVLVAGLDSSSGRAAVTDLPVHQLGYEAGEVVSFSYRGGRAPAADEGSSDWDGISVQPYDRTDSSTDLARRGHLLAELLADVAAERPGVPVDLYAHSQGGLVARLALAELSTTAEGRDVLDRLGLVATMGSPHDGTDLAAMAVLAADTGEGSFGLALAERLLDTSLHPDRATNIADMATGSDLLDALAEQGLPSGPRYLSLGGRGDLVVPDEHARLEGAEHVTLPVDGLSAHAALPGHPATARELGLALAGMSPTCESLVDFIVDAGVSTVVHEGSAWLGNVVAESTTLSVVPEVVGDAFVG